MTNETGRGGLAIIGGLLFVSLVAVALVVGVFLAMSGDSTSVFDLHQGECFVLPIAVDDTSLDEVEPVACTEPHDAEVVLTGQLNEAQDRDYPSDESLFAEIDAACAAVPIPDQFGMLPIAPDEASWQPLGGRFLCVAVPFGGGTVTNPVSTF